MLAREAVSSSWQDQTDFPTHLMSLGSFFALRYKSFRHKEDLEEAIRWTREAVLVNQRLGMDSKESSNNLGVILSWKPEAFRELETSKQAFQNEIFDVEVTSEEGCGSTSVSNLAGFKSSLGFVNIDANEGNDLYSHYFDVWRCESTSPITRLKAAQKASDHLNSLGQWKESSNLLQQAVDLLCTVSSGFLTKVDQQYVLREFSSLGTLAASVILQAEEDVRDAFRVLEKGRGVIFRLSLDRRSDAKREPFSNQGTAAFRGTTVGWRVQCGRRATAHRGSPTRPTISRRKAVDRRSRLEDAVDLLFLSAHIESIGSSTGSWGRGMNHRRQQEQLRLAANVFQPGYTARTGFARPDCADFWHDDNGKFLVQLREAACSGPLIIINDSPIRCDAIIIQGDQIWNTHLPALQSKEIARWNKTLRTIQKSHNGTDLRAHVPQQHRFLEWLWSTAALPAMESLKMLTKPVADQLPRVWWILTGQLSQMPIHAAGRQNGSEYESVMDYVVSSYSSSVRSLAHSRLKPRDSYDKGNDYHLLVSMDETPNLPSLALAAEEVKGVATHLRYRACKPLPNPTKPELLQQIGRAKVFHFAGHSKSNAVDPFKSSLVLSDWQEDPLTVQDLIELEGTPTNNHFLAYLSACDTALNVAVDLQDECINFMSAFQIAGFRHTIGSLGEVEDRLSIQMAKEFYTQLGKAELVTDYAVAFSIHQAARALRSKSSCIKADEDFLGWATFVHHGP